MSSKKIAEPVSLPLKKYLEKGRSRFRQNRLAFALGVSSEFLSDVLSGIKKVPTGNNWKVILAEFYKIDETEAQKLLGFKKDR